MRAPGQAMAPRRTDGAARVTPRPRRRPRLRPRRRALPLRARPGPAARVRVPGRQTPRPHRPDLAPDLTHLRDSTDVPSAVRVPRVVAPSGVTPTPSLPLSLIHISEPTRRTPISY